MRAVFINAGEQTNASNTEHPVARHGHGDHIASHGIVMQRS